MSIGFHFAQLQSIYCRYFAARKARNVKSYASGYEKDFFKGLQALTCGREASNNHTCRRSYLRQTQLLTVLILHDADCESSTQNL
jgi:hypothetical protein